MTDNTLCPGSFFVLLLHWCKRHILSLSLPFSQYGDIHYSTLFMATQKILLSLGKCAEQQVFRRTTEAAPDKFHRCCYVAGVKRESFSSLPLLPWDRTNLQNCQQQHLNEANQNIIPKVKQRDKRYHTVRNLHFLSKNSTLISREKLSIFFWVKNS